MAMPCSEYAVQSITVPSITCSNSMSRIEIEKSDLGNKRGMLPYINTINETIARVERLTQQIQLLVPNWRMAPVVNSLQALRGVSLIVAVTTIAELGDLTRFDHPKKLMAYLGLIPSEHSSGEKRRQGSITKTGNGHVRKVLTEAAHS